MFCKDLKDQAMKIINYEKKEMIPLTDKEKETHENQKICYICEKKIREQENKFIDNMRSMMTSLSQSIDKVSEIDKKIMQIETFHNMYQLCNKDHNKFALLLRKGVYPYECTDSWKRFKEKSLTYNKSQYSKLNNEHITDEDHALAQKVWKVFKINNLGECHDLYVQSDALLLADVFENFRDKCIKNMNLILLTFCLLQDQHDKHV